MQLKALLSVVLLILILVGFLTYAYSTYVMYNESAGTPTDFVSKNKLLYLMHLIIYIGKFGVAALMMYKT